MQKKNEKTEVPVPENYPIMRINVIVCIYCLLVSKVNRKS